jgi:protein involved in polysaccharide export with SLBB domain
MKRLSETLPKAKFWLAALAWLGMAASLGLTACADAPVASTGPTTPQAYRVGPGDRLQVTVFGESNLTGEYDVDDTGAISYPLVGAVPVNNITPREVETGLRERLRRGLITDPKVNVAVIRYRPIFILGEVQKPGVYEFYNGITVLNAVAYAGGYTYRARNSKITVVRAGSAERKAEPVSEGSLLQPGDIIMIPERWF